LSDAMQSASFSQSSLRASSFYATPRPLWPDS
jgi:hypothetical protein